MALAVPARGALGSALLLVGGLLFTGMLPTGGTAAASTIGVAQSFGAQNASGSATLSASPSAATTAGDLLVAVIRDRNITAQALVTSVSDTNAADHWARAAGVTHGSDADGEIWYVAGAASLATSQAVTVTVGGTSASTSAIAVTVLDVTGASATPLDVTATNSGNTQPASTGATATTTQAGEIAIGDIGWNSNVTPSAQTVGYTTTAVQQSTVSGSAAGEQAAFQVLGSTGAQSYSATLSTSTVAWTGAIATFKVSTGPPPVPTISSFNPTSGSPTTPVVITGTGFTGASAVAFHGTAATVSVTDDSHISTTVPGGATTGQITVTTPGGTATSAASFTVTSAPTPPHVMLIVEENQEYGSIIGNSSNASYINNLATTYASATNWYAVQHNSPHDYLDLIAGSDLGLPNGTRPYTATTLVDELHAKSIPWQGYMENMPSTCYTGSTTPDGLYDPIHNPFHYFANYTTTAGGWCNSSNLSTEGALPYPSGGVVTALTGSNAPDFVFISPNNCDNMHSDTNTGSPCASSTTNQLIKAGDTWLSTNLAPVLTSTWFKQNGIVIITWDEGTSNLGCCGLGTGAGGHIATVVITSNNKGLGTFASQGDHYGTLAAIEKTYGVGLLLNSANSAHGDLSGAFGSATTGTISGTVSDSQTPAQPISAASISYTGTGGTTGSGTTTTNSSGGYTFNGVPPGTYSVTATATGFTTPSAQPVTVTAGTSATANFTMTATSGISGTVTDSVTNAAIVTATVAYSGTGGTTGSGSTTAINSTTGAYTLSGVPPGTYTVTASAPGYTSQSLTSVTVTAGNTATANFALVAGTSQPIFSDGFESGTFSSWTSTSGLAVESTTVHTGTHAAEGSITGDAQKLLPSTYNSGYERVWFNVVSQTSQINVLRARTAAGGNLAYVMVLQTSHLLALNVLGTRVATSTNTVAPGSGWHELEMYAAINGATPSVEVWLDGTQVTSLTWNGSLGSTPIGEIQIGEASGQTWDVAYDDAAFDTQFLP